MGLYSVSGSFALTAATVKTVIRVNSAATRKVTARRVIVTDGLAGSTDAGILVRLMRGGTDGTGTAATPMPTGSAVACASTGKVNYTVEPTGSPVELKRWVVPSGGGLDIPLPSEEGMEAPHSSALYLELTSAAAKGSNIVGAELVFEE